MRGSMSKGIFSEPRIAGWPQKTRNIMGVREQEVPGELGKKASVYDAWNVEYHQPYFGCIAQGISFNSNKYSKETINSYDDIGDSACWSGIYLASQAWRYDMTHSEAAKENIIRMVGCLIALQEVTGTRGYIARYVGPQHSIAYESVKGNHEIRNVSSGKYAGNFWMSSTSKDQYVGWILGMALAYDLFDHYPTRDIIRNMVGQVVGALIDQGWKILDETGELSQRFGVASLVPIQSKLSWTLTAYHITGNPKFLRELQRRLNWWNIDWLLLNSINFYHKYLTGYYVFNLNHVTSLTLLRLAESYFSTDIYTKLRDIFDKYGHKPVLLSHNPWFNAIYMGIGGYKHSHPSKYSKNSDPYKEQLYEDLIDFRECPNHEYHLPDRDNSTYNFAPWLKYFRWYIDLNTWLMNKYEWLEPLENIAPKLVAESAFPIREQCNGDFLFQKNPFRIFECGHDRPYSVYAGVDYLAAYWIARYYNLISYAD